MSADILEMVTAYQRTALVAAACETGVAGALAGQGGTARQIAGDLGLDARAVTALVGAMSALGLATRSGDRFRLSPAGATLDPGHPETVAGIVAKEWFFYGAWAGLPQTIRDGHARIAPWTDRLAADRDTSLRFLGALDDLGARFGGELPGLAGIPSPSRVLDVGGGSGIHAANLRAHGPGVSVTVLDLEPVGELVRSRHPELDFVAGDLHEERFGRPEGEAWDVILLANVLHDVPPDTAREIVARAARMLGGGGGLVIYEWLLDETRDRPPDVALFAVMMMVENEGGAAYTEGEVRGWLADAGLECVETRRGDGPIAVVRGWKP